jgi:hypothetical protein
VRTTEARLRKSAKDLAQAKRQIEQSYELVLKSRDELAKTREVLNQKMPSVLNRDPSPANEANSSVMSPGLSELPGSGHKQTGIRAK